MLFASPIKLLLNIKETKEQVSSKFTKRIKINRAFFSLATDNLNGSVMPYLILSRSVLIHCQK